MHRLATALLFLVPNLACADRITEMNGAELCAYKARLSVAAYYYYQKGKPRAEVTIHWHGDETPNEIEFVTLVLDEAYATAAADKQTQPEKFISEQAFGERAYKACMSAGQT